MANILPRVSPATSRRMVRSNVPGFGTGDDLPLDISTDHGIDATACGTTATAAAAAAVAIVDEPAPPPPPPPPLPLRMPLSLFSAHL